MDNRDEIMQSRYELPDELYAKLWRLRQALRFRLAGEGLAWVLVVLVAGVFGTLAVDYTLRLDERVLRLIVLGLAVAGVCAVIWSQLLRPLYVAMTPEALALLVERAYPQLEDRLAGAVGFAAGRTAGVSAALVARMGDEARHAAAAMNFNRVVERRRLHRVALIALASVMLLGGFTVWKSGIMRRWFQRNVLLADAAVAPWPQETYLSVRGGPHFTVLRGQDLRITVGVAAGSVAPREITLHRTLASVGRASQEVIPLTGDKEPRYEKVIRNIHEPFSFYVTGGDDDTDKRNPHQVHVIDPPWVESVSLTVRYPAYTQREPVHHDDGEAAAAVPFGGTAVLRAAINKPATAEVRLGTWRIDPVTGERGEFVGRTVWRSGSEPGAATRTFEARVVLSDDNVFAEKMLNIRLRDESGHTNGAGQDFSLRVIPDEPPTVTIAKIGGLPDMRYVTPNAVLPVRITARDGYGLAVGPVPEAWTSLVEQRARELQTTPQGVREDFVAPALSVRIAREDNTEAATRPVKVLVRPAQRSHVTLRHEASLDGAVSAGQTARLAAVACDARPDELAGPGRRVSEPLELHVVERSELSAKLFARQRQLADRFAGAVQLETTACAKTAAVAETPASAPPALLEDSARAQRVVADQCAEAATTFAGLLEEMEYNGIGDANERVAVAVGIINPLKSLATRGVNVAVTLERLADAGGDVANAAAEQQRILTEMKAVARRMEKLRTLQVMADRVERMIDWLEKLQEEIDTQRRRDIEELFGTTTRPTEREPTP